MSARPAASAGVRDAIVERVPFGAHEGASGATLERARLVDGTRLVLKRFDADHDLTLALPPAGVIRELALWRAGVLDRLPPGVGHAIVDAWEEDGTPVLAMNDLSGTMLGWGDYITREQFRQLVTAATRMHDAFRGEAIAQALSFDQRITVFAESTMRGVLDRGSALPESVLVGWDRFAHLAPPEVTDLVFAIHDQPALLTEPLSARYDTTFLHGDMWINNVALDPEGNATLIDWALATQGPPIAEFVSFMVGCSSNVQATRDEMLDDIRDIMGEGHDEDGVRLGLVCGVVEMGWNKAVEVTEHGGREVEEEFDWWIAAAQRALEAGDFDVDLVTPPQPPT